MDAILAGLSDKPEQHPDCCCAISRKLVNCLLHRLPARAGSLVLSIGSGTGLLEEMLRRESHFRLNLLGVEVPSCPNKYLPDERVLRVSSTTDLHPDALLAEAWLFVYPRKPSLLRAYLDAFRGGAMQTMLVILNRAESLDFAPVVENAFAKVEVVQDCGLAAYEVLVLGSVPKLAPFG